MKKFICLFISIIFLMAIFTLTGCSKGGVNSLINGGETHTFETEKSPLELSAKEVFLAFIDKVSKLNSYEISASGTSSTKILNVSQKVKAGTIKNGNEYYTYNSTDSTFVHTRFCAFFKDDKVAYDPDNTEAKSLTVKTTEEYKDIYGVVPFEKTLNGFILNDDTIISAERISENADDTITYSITLDGNLAGANNQIQMKKFGGLNTYPNFKKVSFTLIIKNDWTPISLTSNLTYEISATFAPNATCNEKVTYSYSKINETVSIPNRETFINKLSA